MLKSIEISGFKSFAKKSSLFFGSRVVGVVGPNGSGKSNVAESFRFVLGEQSMKALRSGKGEDLIWNGSVAVPKANKASVSLTFDNSQQLFPSVDLPEVTIERAVYRDGQNEYSLNGKQVRLKDITELLASISIGTSKHHIISQGQADRMLNSSPAERREMLLDSLGLTAVDLRKSEAERNLHKTDGHLHEVEALRKEARPRLLFLEKQMDKFRKAEKVREELVQKSVTYIIQEGHAVHSASTSTVEQSREPRQTLNSLQLKRETLRAKTHDGKDVTVQTNLENDATATKRRIVETENALTEIIRERAKIAARIELLDEADVQQPTHIPRQPHTQTVTVTIPAKHVEELRQAESKVSTTVRMSGDYSSAFRELQSALVRFWSSIPKETPPEPLATLANSRSSLDTTAQRAAFAARDMELSSKEKALLVEQQSLHASLRATESTLSNLKLSSVESEREVLELSAQIAELASRVRDLDRAAEDIALRKEALTALQTECETLLGNQFRLALAQERNSKTLTPSLPAISYNDIQRLKIRVEELGLSDGEVEGEYTQAKERDEFLAKELADVTSARDSLVALIAKLESEMNATFTNGLLHINESFEIFFRSLFGGGEARLIETTDKSRRYQTAPLLDNRQQTQTRNKKEPQDEDEEGKTKAGIDIQVHLPKKKVSSLAILSGGERALTSIALICALSQVNPPPFIILDETDAALDEANSTRFANMVQTLSEKSQCIVITHNRATMAAAGELYGITMGSDGVSKLLSVKLEEAERVAK